MFFSFQSKTVADLAKPENEYRTLALLARNRGIVWLVELLVQAVLFGAALGITATVATYDEVSDTGRSLLVQLPALIIGSAIATAVVFMTSGYAFATAAVRLCLSPVRPWRIPLCSAALALAYIAIFIHSDENFTPSLPLRAVFLIVLSMIAAACTHWGRHRPPQPQAGHPVLNQDPAPYLSECRKSCQEVNRTTHLNATTYSAQVFRPTLYNRGRGKNHAANQPELAGYA